MAGYYRAFPSNIHLIETYITTMATKKVQERVIRLFHELNQQEFSFDDIANPTIPQGTVNFNIGIAGTEKFNLITTQQINDIIEVLAKENIQTIDFFIAIRYYKNTSKKRIPLRFDYYLMRSLFSKDSMELQIVHESGPRYITPEDLTTLIFNKINDGCKKKTLKKLNSDI